MNIFSLKSRSEYQSCSLQTFIQLCSVIVEKFENIHIYLHLNLHTCTICPKNTTFSILLFPRITRLILDEFFCKGLITRDADKLLSLTMSQKATGINRRVFSVLLRYSSDFLLWLSLHNCLLSYAKTDFSLFCASAVILISYKCYYLTKYLMFQIL